MAKTTRTMTELRCPACGSDDIETHSQNAQYAAPMGPVVAFEQTENVCKSCGTAGDFGAVNDSEIAEARKQSAAALVSVVLDKLIGLGRSNAYVERALGLPSRTLARWKAGEGSASAAALMRVVATYPWVLEVAERRFDPSFAKRALLVAAGEVLDQTLQQYQVVCHASVVNREPSMNVNLHFSPLAAAAHSSVPGTPTTPQALPNTNLVGARLMVANG